MEITTVPGPFGEGLLVSSVQGRAMVTATDQANPIFRDVLTSVFNNSLLLDITTTTHNTHVFYFVKVGCVVASRGRMEGVSVCMMWVRLGWVKAEP